MHISGSLQVPHRPARLSRYNPDKRESVSRLPPSFAVFFRHRLWRRSPTRRGGRITKAWCSNSPKEPVWNLAAGQMGILSTGGRVWNVFCFRGGSVTCWASGGGGGGGVCFWNGARLYPHAPASSKHHWLRDVYVMYTWEPMKTRIPRWDSGWSSTWDGLWRRNPCCTGLPLRLERQNCSFKLSGMAHVKRNHNGNA